MNYTLKNYGLENYIRITKTSLPDRVARVTRRDRGIYTLATADGEIKAEVSGKFRRSAESEDLFPAVGDWTEISGAPGENAFIERILPRFSEISRKAAGKTSAAQVIAANIDTVFITMALTEDFNIRRLERYLGIAYAARALPAVILTKADLCPDTDEKLARVREVSFGLQIFLTDINNPDSHEQIRTAISYGQTACFIGSSGVGKSTIINRLANSEILATGGLRDDGKGRHTTTFRRLFLLEGGGAVIDTPGMRELGLETADLDRTFAEITELARHCRFSDCTHTGEPGCAVAAGIESGEVSRDRLNSFLKLQTEVSYENMSSRELENAKIKRMFGGKNEMKNTMRQIKNKNKR